MQANVYTVSQINRYIKRILENDVVLQDVFLEAEISNFKPHSSGHWYFTLKDEAAAINAVMFRSSTLGVKFMPENGMRVLIYGRISLYEKTGQYQLYANLMEPAGKGALYMAYEQLKQKLSEEGLFEEDKKKPIPEFPQCIAVVTSPMGAAIRDILQITKRRNPRVKIVVVPVLVQGENAATDIANAIEKVNAWGKADTMIIGRGGGSIEDLWAFNEEIVARAVYNSRIPVISAVGHETDFTIADFVADMRAPTPSAAAELAVPSAVEQNERRKNAHKKLNLIFFNKFNRAKTDFENISNKRVLKFPLEDVYKNQIYTEQLYKRLNVCMNRLLNDNRLIFGKAVSTMESVSPMNVIKRGYSLTYKGSKLITSINDVKPGDKISITLSDGKISTTVENTEE